MRVESKLALWINFVTMILGFFSLVIITVIAVIFGAIVFSDNPISLMDVSMFLFLITIGVGFFSASMSLRRKIILDLGHLKIAYFFGLITWSYRYSSLSISNYFMADQALLIELENGDQLTIGEKQYKNYYQLKDLLLTNIKDKRNLEVKFANRLTIILIFSNLFSLILFIISKGITTDY